MSASKHILPAALLTGAALFTGCFNDGSSVAGSDEGAQAPAAALTASATWSYIGSSGFLPAFTGITTSNSGFVLDSNYSPRPVGGYALKRIVNNTSTLIPGGLVDLDIMGNNEIWGTSDQGGVFRNATPINPGGGTWSQITTPDYYPKNGSDFRKIATGSNGSVFMLGKATVYGANGGGGHVIYQYSGSGTSSSSWTLIPGGLMDIDVDNNGDLLGVNSIGEVFKRTAAGVWSRLAYDAKWKKIACGNGKYYVLSGEARSGGYTIYKWDGAFFVNTNSAQGMKEIQVDAGGGLWGANDLNLLYRYIP
ncbi:MAG: beta-propeller repeat [Fibrobacteres bacterium]|nr:beta-propeller repeat [Fibrobacterota bacterium]